MNMLEDSIIEKFNQQKDTIDQVSEELLQILDKRNLQILIVINSLLQVVSVALKCQRDSIEYLTDDEVFESQMEIVTATLKILKENYYDI